MRFRAHSAVHSLIGFVLIVCTASEVIESVSEKGPSMKELVHSLSDHLIYFNSDLQSTYEQEIRVRRSSSDVEPKRASLIEYASIDCNLTCWIQASRHNSNVLTCKPKLSTPATIKVVPVQTDCTEHRSGRLLHIVISPAAKDSQADFISDGFSKNLQNALLTLHPSLEVLFLTIEIPITQIRKHDFKHIAKWLRRLSLFLAHTNMVDRGVLQSLTLDSFTAEGCDLLDTTVNTPGNVCTVEFLLSCPEVDFLPLLADQATHRAHCSHQQMEVIEKKTSTDLVETVSCQELKAIFSSLSYLKTEPNDYLYMLLLSLWTNVILSSLLISILLYHAVFFFRARTVRLYRENR